MPPELNELESLFLDTSKTENLIKINAIFQELNAADISPSLKSALVDGSELLFESYPVPTKESIEVTLHLARLNIDSLSLRDLLRASARKVFKSYSDPAGLLNGLEVNKDDIMAGKIVRNWNVYKILLQEFADKDLLDIQTSERTFCFHESYAFGEVLDIDSFGNFVNIIFNSRQKIDLEMFMNTCQLVIPGSLLFRVLEGNAMDEIKSKSFIEVKDEFNKNIYPLHEFDRSNIKGALIFNCFKSDSDVDKWLSDKKENAKKAVNKTSFQGARSLAELQLVFKADSAAKVNATDFEHLKKIFIYASDKPAQVNLFCECMSELNKRIADKKLILELYKIIGEKTLCWNDSATFVKATNKLSQVYQLNWLDATVNAHSEKFLAEQCLEFPLKGWNNTEKIIGKELLLETARLHLKKGRSSADIFLWIWNTYKKEADSVWSIIGNPSAVLRSLATEKAGEYKKSTKDLRKMVITDEVFQAFLMKNGDKEAISTLANTVKASSELDAGEKQSILVKMTRLYDEAKVIIEKGYQKPAEEKIERITSVKTYEAKRLELLDIANNLIPENTEAIAVARDFGDLKENAEFKAAKERQKYLISRQTELEVNLTEIRATDFTETKVTDTVIPGSIVELEMSDGTKEIYTLLGVWDSVPEIQYVSFETPLGASLLGLKENASVTLPNGKEGKVLSIKELDADVIAWING